MTSITLNLAPSILGKNDGGVWIKYPASSVPSPFVLPDTAPPGSSLSYWALDLTQLGPDDAPYLSVGRGSLPLWLATADLAPIGTPSFATSTGKKMPISADGTRVVCGSAALTLTNNSSYLIVPMSYSTTDTAANKNAYLEQIGNSRNIPRKHVDWSAAGWATLWTVIIMFILSIILAIFGFVFGIVKDMIIL